MNRDELSFVGQAASSTTLTEEAGVLRKTQRSPAVSHIPTWITTTTSAGNALDGQVHREADQRTEADLSVFDPDNLLEPRFGRSCSRSHVPVLGTAKNTEQVRPLIDVLIETLHAKVRTVKAGAAQ